MPIRRRRDRGSTPPWPRSRCSGSSFRRYAQDIAGREYPARRKRLGRRTRRSAAAPAARMPAAGAAPFAPRIRPESSPRNRLGPTITAHPSTRSQWSYHASISARFTACLDERRNHQRRAAAIGLPPRNQPCQVLHHRFESIHAHDGLVRCARGSAGKFTRNNVQRRIGQPIDRSPGSTPSKSVSKAIAPMPARWASSIIANRSRMQQRIADAAENQPNIVRRRPFPRTNARADLRVRSGRSILNDAWRANRSAGSPGAYSIPAPLRAATPMHPARRRETEPIARPRSRSIRR